MKDLRELIKTLDNIESERLLPKIKGYLMELERHRKKAGSSKAPRWNVIGRDGSPMEREPLYLTAQARGSKERSLMEGFLENGKWYGEDGVNLKSRRLEVIAWLPKEPPQPYQGVVPTL